MTGNRHHRESVLGLFIKRKENGTRAQHQSQVEKKLQSLIGLQLERAQEE